MKIVYEDEEFVFARMALMAAIVLFGVPGNLFSICTNIKLFRMNELNGIVYLHLGVVDCFICFVHAVIGLILESLGFYSLQSDLGSWTEALKFLAENIGLKVYFCSTIISMLSLTFIALLRCWRIIKPFACIRRKLFTSGIFLVDISAIVLVFFYKKGDRHWSIPSAITTNQTFWMNVTSGMSNYLNNSVDFSDVVGLLSPVKLSNATFSNTTLDSSHGGDNPVGTTTAPDGNFILHVIAYSLASSMAITVVCYLLITVTLCKENRKQEARINSLQARILRRQIKNVVTQFILFSVLLCSTVPALYVSSDGPFGFGFKRLLITVGVLNNAINPYIYCVLFPNNRRKITSRCCRR